MVAATARRQAEGLQSFDPFRHLGPVTDLIGQAFSGELGPAARRTLRRMRRVARWGGLGLWLAGVESRALGAPGFVWIEDGEVVGNLSLRRAAFPGGWMIGNVAVAPPWQGRGIGRTLMEAAVDVARERGGTWIGLEVREDNAIARGLYEHMGFETVGTMVEVLRPAGRSWPTASVPPAELRRARASESRSLYQLARKGLTRPHREVLEVRRATYRAGWEATIAAFLEGVRESWQIAQRGDEGVGGVRVSTRWLSRWHRVEVVVEPDRLDDLGPRLVAAAVDELAGRRPWEATALLPGPQEALEPAFAAAGFRRLRRLAQMRLSLGRRIEVH
jgi:ribosomal protein S18 acetylase RimI-like enzyme